MPNHTTNIMTVTGPFVDITRFVHKVSHKNPNLINYYKEKLEKDICSNKEALKLNPNNKYTQMTLSNNEKELKNILEATWINHLDFNGTVPMPISLNITSPAKEEEKDVANDNIKKYGHADWYGWCSSNDGWGTKWGAYDVQEPEILKDKVIYRYSTAWSPPLPWIQKTSKMFPSLTFEIAASDEGGDYYIENTYKNGVIIERDNMSSYDWRMKYEDSFKETVDSIFNVPYEEGILYISKLGEIDYSLEDKLIKHIKDEDLPLFINFSWQSESAKELYLNRIKK